MMKKLSIFAFFLCLAMLTNWGFAAQERDYVVIVHPDNVSSTLDKDKVSQLLLKKSSRWDDGRSAEPIDLDAKSPVREALSRDVHGRSVNSIKSYWQRQIFSGRSVPPPEARSDAEVVSWVASRPGAIGYVSPSASLSGVKAVTVIE